jgi:hypothetical protein
MARKLALFLLTIVCGVRAFAVCPFGQIRSFTISSDTTVGLHWTGPRDAPPGVVYEILSADENTGDYCTFFSKKPPHRAVIATTTDTNYVFEKPGESRVWDLTVQVQGCPDTISTIAWYGDTFPLPDKPTLVSAESTAPGEVTVQFRIDDARTSTVAVVRRDAKDTTGAGEAPIGIYPDVTVGPGSVVIGSGYCPSGSTKGVKDRGLAPGIYIYHLWASNGSARYQGVSESTSVCVVVDCDECKCEGPEITDVDREYEGVFLRGTRLQNVFTAKVDWKGRPPGKVTFTVAGGASATEQGNEEGARHAFAMDSDFTPQAEPNRVIIQATSIEGEAGEKREEEVSIVDYPPWLTAGLNINNLQATAGNGEVRYGLNFEFPRPHLAEKGPIRIPENFPFLGSTNLGLTETFLRVEGTVSSVGTGNFSLSAQSGLDIANVSLTGKGEGGGELRLAPDGLSLRRGSVIFRTGLSAYRTVSIVELIPKLRELENIPYIGPAIHRFARSVEATARLTGSFSFGGEVAAPAHATNLAFSSAGSYGVTLAGNLNVPISRDHLSARMWIGGGGSAAFATPPRDGYLTRSVELGAQAGIEFKFDWLIQLEARATANAGCEWTPEDGMECAFGGDIGSEAAAVTPTAQRTHTVKNDYAAFGAYSAVENDGGAIVTNVFPGASPQWLELPDGRGVLLWAHQNPALPALQSTDIAWSIFDGNAWTAPAFIRADTRAELAPAAGVDSTGRIVATWLRIKDAAFASPIERVDDLPSFYKRLEVVSAVFDPSARTWSDIVEVTRDDAFDSDLRVSRSAAGHLMLTWLSNAAGDFLSLPSSPSVLRASFWSGTSWSAPATIAGRLEGVGEHAPAISNDGSAFVIVSRGTALDLYQSSGSAWIGPTLFSSSGDDHDPSAAYDSQGTGHVVWVRNGDLMHATLSARQPVVIRGDSQAAGFVDVRLLTNPAGNLTLVWLDVGARGAAQLLGRVYDTNRQRWSKDLVLSDDSGAVRAPHAAYGADGVLRVAHVSAEVISGDETVSLDGKSVVIPNVPHEGRSDLRLLEHPLETDLSLTAHDVVLDPQRPQKDATFTMTVDVHNSGDFATPAFSVAVYAGAPEAGGARLATKTVGAPFDGGDHTVLTFTLRDPGDRPLIVIADATNTVAESDETNNRATLLAKRRRAVRSH